MKKLTFLIILLCSPLCLIAADSKDSKKSKSTNDYVYDETVMFPLNIDDWKVGYQNATKNGSATTRYFVHGENQKKWTKIVNIQFKDISLAKGETAIQVMAHEQSLSPKAKSKIISSKQNDILYERSFPSGEEEIVRLIVTKKGVHRLAYIKKGHIEEEERKEWIERLSAAKTGLPPKAEKTDKKGASSDSKKG